MLLLRGALVGVAVAAPVGPIGLLCIQRTIARGRAHGLWTGLGAATADTLFAAAAALGLSVSALGGHTALRLAGAAMVAWIGVRAAMQESCAKDDGGAAGAGTAYLQTLALTLSSPMTIASFAAVLAAMLPDGARGPDAAWFVAGIFLGSTAWWLALTQLVHVLRGRLLAHVRLLNRAAGAALVAMAIWLAAKGLR